MQVSVRRPDYPNIFPLRRPYIRICRTEEQNAIAADSCSQMRDTTVVAHKSDVFKDGSEMGQRKIFGKSHARIFPNCLEPVRFRLIRLPADDKNRSAKIWRREQGIPENYPIFLWPVLFFAATAA